MSDRESSIHKEGNLDDFVQYIFGGEIHSPTSIQFLGEFDTTKELFEALLMVFTGGMKLRYSNDKGVVDLDLLEKCDVQDIQQRFISINLSVIIKKYHHAQVNAFRQLEIPEAMEINWLNNSYQYQELCASDQLIPYSEVQSESLSDFYFQLVSGYNYYVISFRHR